MNENIKTNIEQGIQYLKVGIIDALSNLESEKEKKTIKFGTSLPLKLIIKCAEERGWEENMDDDWDWTNGWEVDYCYKMIFPNKNIRLNICGSLLYGNTILEIDDYEND